MLLSIFYLPEYFMYIDIVFYSFSWHIPLGYGFIFHYDLSVTLVCLNSSLKDGTKNFLKQQDDFILLYWRYKDV